ncbi:MULTISPECIES: trypco2 family protein [unclassified Streptomyces]|uniref:trypco2 family protein n=1 Tax=unclassified Streptomyces TaxID=2593676 RepID=UPI00225C1A3B|nr:trypco2 family protein [Streptomyces sp. NBC_00047]MCX5613068.1 hypothetical protein [Streptomyces sp. NBC_00047]
MENSEVIGLAETIRSIRQELETAMRQGAESGLKFGVGPVEVELTVEARLEKGGSGKLRIWVVDAGGDAKKTDSRLHRIKVVLNPIDAQGNPALIASSGYRSNL